MAAATYLVILETVALVDTVEVEVVKPVATLCGVSVEEEEEVRSKKMGLM